MNLQKVQRIFSWRVIALHLFGCLSLVYAFQTLALLTDLRLIAFARQGTPQMNLNFAIENNLMPDDLIKFTRITSISGLFALLCSTGMSISVILKRRFSWLHTVIAVILAYVLLGTFPFFWLFASAQFKDSTLEVLSKGLVLLSLSVALFGVTLRKPGKSSA